MDTTSITAIAKLFIDLVNVIKDALSKSDKAKKELIGLGSLLKLYGSSVKLRGLSLQLLEFLQLQRDKLSDEEERLFLNFLQEIRYFGENLKDVDLYVVDIYYPGLGAHLNQLMGRDVELVSYYNSKLAPRYGLKKGKEPRVLQLFLEHYDYGGWTTGRGKRRLDSSFFYDWFEQNNFLSNPEFSSALVILIEGLEACRNQIASIIRENWDFKELTI